jgi:FkbM family methyltransferase
MDKVIRTVEFRGVQFKFVDTKSIDGIVAEIFADNYHVFSSGIEIRPGDVILDLGANEGAFSIMMSKLFPETRVISFEPVPRTYETFMKNIQLNGCGNISPFLLGVAGQAGAAVLNVSKDYSGGSSAWCTYNPDHHDQVEIITVPIDSIFEQCRVDRIRLMKIDVEGAEYEALYAMKRLLYVDYLAAEFHTNLKIETNMYRLQGLISWVSNQTKLISVEMCRMAE